MTITLNLPWLFQLVGCFLLAAIPSLAVFGSLFSISVWSSERMPLVWAGCGVASTVGLTYLLGHWGGLF